MVPKPESQTRGNKKDMNYSRIHPENDDDDIVITGIGGNFPACKDLNEFKHNLYNKVDMVHENTFVDEQLDLDVPERYGRINGLDMFDAGFFGVHTKQAYCMEPQTRVLLEKVHEAIMDAGINPKLLRGSRTAVFAAMCFSDTEIKQFYDITCISPTGFAMPGCSRGMLANRTSFCFGFNGPSFTMDAGAAGSMQALCMAYALLRSNEIDAAVVAGTNISLFSDVSAQYKSYGHLSPDGYSRPFDESSSGYNRSDTIACIFLQKKRNAKRVYAHVIHTKSNHDGHWNDGIVGFPKKMKEDLLEKFYREVQISPNYIGYMEANASGIPHEDVEECKVIEDILCKNRNTPLLIGSIKSNIGYTDAASGVSSIVKACFALESNKIAPNIHFKNPRKEITGLHNGKLKVVTEVEDLKTPYIGINSYGLTGENSHALLKGFNKAKKNFGIPDDDLPRLVNWAGRTEEGVDCVFDFIHNKPLDAEYIGLLHETQTDSTTYMLFRGYALFAKDENGNARCIERNVERYRGIKQPIIWVFSGMGSQWNSMGSSLMDIPLIRQSIEASHKVLEPKGLNLIDILTSKDPLTYNNILHSFVGIAAIQIALVDLLRTLDLEPDYIIGHSVGELGCGYADGGLTAEQMILCAYSRGKVSLETEKIRGSMAAVGIGYTQILPLLPKEIEVACHNSFESCTISGPAEEVTKFVAVLKAQKIFAKEVPCSNIAYHSRYIAQMGPNLLKYLKEILPNPKPRSSKWLSSSVPKHNWSKPEAQNCSAEYHTNNLLSSVLFEETADLLPKEAIAIEIAPHGLLQAILKRSMIKAVHIPLTQRGHKNNSEFLMQSLGKIYMNGVEMAISRIYPKINFPVSRETPNISSLVKWDHSHKWKLFDNTKDETSGEEIFGISLEDIEFLRDCKIKNKNFVPSMYILQRVIEFFIRLKKSNLMKINLELEDLKVKANLDFEESEKIVLKTLINFGNGEFSVTNGSHGNSIFEGTIRILEEPDNFQKMPTAKAINAVTLSKQDIYKELQLRGIEYSESFMTMLEARDDGSSGKIRWNVNLGSFLESMVQFYNISLDTREPNIFSKIRRLRIMGDQHMKILNKNNMEVPVSYHKNSDRIVAGGIEIIGLDIMSGDKSYLKKPSFEISQFIPFFCDMTLNQKDALKIFSQIIAENSSETLLEVLELISNGSQKVHLAEDVCNLLNGIPAYTAFIGVYRDTTSLSNNNVIIFDEFLANANMQSSLKDVEKNIWIISREKFNLKIQSAPSGFNVISALKSNSDILVLLRRENATNLDNKALAIHVTETDTKWIDKVKTCLGKQKVILYSKIDEFPSFSGMVDTFQQEGKLAKLSMVFIGDPKAPDFNKSSPFYMTQLKLGLSVNILKEGQWGTLRNMNLKSQIIEKLQTCYFYGKIDKPGDLSTLNWYQGSLNPTNCDIQVIYSSLNFQDCLLATGRVHSDICGKNRLKTPNLLGMEFSGITQKSGKRMMGITMKGSLSSHLNLNSRFVWEVPKNWTLRDAATVPLAYTTIYYAFFQIAKIQKGKTILIHSGCSTIGLAAIEIAFAYGLEVFTTVGTEEKKKFLQKKFPMLEASHIGNSNDTSFEAMIQEYTKDGVNYILNSLDGDRLITSIRCLTVKGHFLELGKFDMMNRNKMGLGVFMKELSFHTVSLNRFFYDEVEEKVNKIKELISKDIAAGIIKPIPSIVFKPMELQSAFRYLTSKKRVGKVLVEIRPTAGSDESYPLKMIQQMYFDANKSYIVYDSFQSFGLEFVDWLVTRGARHIVVNSVKNISNSYQSYKARIWETHGTKVTFNTNYEKSKDKLKQQLENTIKQNGPIGGIFCLNSSENCLTFEHQKPETFSKTLNDKLNYIKYLNELSQTDSVGLHLDHFVILSTVGDLPSNVARATLENLIENRLRKNLPGKMINLGAIANEQAFDGVSPEHFKSYVNELDQILFVPYPILSLISFEKAVEDYKLQIFDTIKKLLLIDDLESIDGYVHLVDIGLNSLGVVQLQQILKDSINTDVPIEKIGIMSIKKLKELIDDYEYRLRKESRTINVNLSDERFRFENYLTSDIKFEEDYH